MASREDRKLALEFYIKEATGPQKDWVDTGKGGAEIDPDFIALACLLARVRYEGSLSGQVKPT